MCYAGRIELGESPELGSSLTLRIIASCLNNLSTGDRGENGPQSLIGKNFSSELLASH